MTIDLTKLAVNAKLVERLAWDFDLRIDIAPPEPAWFTIEGVSDLELIGSEGAGGSFVRLPDARILMSPRKVKRARSRPIWMPSCN